MERQDKLALRKGDSTAFIRMDAVNEETLNGYFDLIEDSLIYKIHHPTSTKLESHWTKNSGPQRNKTAEISVPGSKKQITVIACGNAAGNVLATTFDNF